MTSPSWAQLPGSGAAGSDYDTLFQQMMKNPKDLDVTFRFASMAADRGDYEAAIGALERMLFYNPNLPRVRMELGVMYFKLGSYQMARTYFQAVATGQDVPPDVRGKANSFIAEIDKRLQPSQFGAFAHFGYRHQSNANVGPGGTSVLAFGFPATLNVQAAAQPDWNTFALAGINYAYDLGNQRGDTIEASVIGYGAAQFNLHAYDLYFAEAQVGPRLAFFPSMFRNTTLKIYSITNTVNLGNAPYYYTVGGGVSLRTYIGLTTIEPQIEYRHRKFQSSETYPIADQQTGDLFVTAVNGDGFVSFLHWVARAEWDRNSAQVFTYNSYDRLAGDVGFPFEFNVPFCGEDHKWVLTPQGGGSWVYYPVPNPIVDPVTLRIDREWHVGAALDMNIYKNFGLRTQVMYSKTDSTLPNYTFTNFWVAFGPTIRW